MIDKIMDKFDSLTRFRDFIKNSATDKILLRNFMIFFSLLIIGTGSLGYVILRGGHEMERVDLRIRHTHDIIIEAEQISSFIEGMLSAQRGYLLTGDKSFLEKYELLKIKTSENFAKIAELIIDNPSQQSRLKEAQSYLADFTQQLESRATKYSGPIVDKTFVDDVQIVNGLKDNIARINYSLLSEEHGLLRERVEALDNKKQEYLFTLIASLAGGTILLLSLNGILFYAQRKNTIIETTLRNTEDRFALAIEATQAGVYDWDLETNKIFFARRYFEMLGYERPASIGTFEEAREFIHPDDISHVDEITQDYLTGKIGEFSLEFRMKHASGRWIWVHSRGKAQYDRRSKPRRLVGALNDITHIKQSHERLENEKRRAQEASLAKIEFLAHMSHEIRTPLTAISGIAEIMDKRKDNLDERQKQLMRTLSSSSSSLKDLVNDILDFSKIESGELELNTEDFPMDEIFEGVISIMALRASEKGISFVFDYSEVKDMIFHGDRVRLRQILINLAGNAVKFTDQGGVSLKATIEDRESQPYLRIDVKDTGIGISPENFDMIFERFKQADASVSRKYGGTGLGLPISRNLARLMGGDIFLASETGKGSTFSLVLPMGITAQPSIAQSNPDLARKINERIKLLLSDDTKILVVEDYEGNIVVISYILDDLQIAHDIAHNGAEALELWQNNKYDIILMDVQMPEMDGFTATREIRKLENERKMNATPIIGMTAHALVGDKDKCIEAGMNAYLPKPLVEIDVKAEILNFLENKKKAAA